MAVIRDMTPARKAASLMGYVAVGWALGPMLGPLLGGALDAAFGWRASFVAFVAFGAAVLALCWVDLGETNRSRSDTFAAQLRSYPELFRSRRSEEHTSELQSLMRISYAVFCLKNKIITQLITNY